MFRNEGGLHGFKVVPGIVLGILLLIVSCAEVPITHRQSLHLVPDSELMTLSYQQYNQVLHKSRLSADTQEEAMVRRVGGRIARVAETFLREAGQGDTIKNYHWEFNLIEDEKTVNAWVMQGGKAAVYSGILRYSQDETGLAVVLGHEVGHAETIQELLARYPNITVQRIWEELRDRGYGGGYSILCERVGQLRPRPQTPWIERFETGPGVQAQMDYAVYTLDFTQEGRRRVNLFSLILSYSRRQYLRFVEAQDMETTQRQHILAFQHLGGVPATCLYDCMKVVVSRHEDDQPIYNPRFLAFATHYGYRPVACRPRRPQTKGNIERPFQYVESRLLGGREFRSLEKGMARSVKLVTP